MKQTMRVYWPNCVSTLLYSWFVFLRLCNFKKKAAGVVSAKSIALSKGLDKHLIFKMVNNLLEFEIKFFLIYLQTCTYTLAMLCVSVSVILRNGPDYVDQPRLVHVHSRNRI